MTMCKHGIGASYCALCNHKRVLPNTDDIGYDIVTTFKVEPWLMLRDAEYKDRQRALNESRGRSRDERYR